MARKNKRTNKKIAQGPIPPDSGKRPRGSIKSEEASKKKFTWRIKHVDFTGDWGWENVPARTLLSTIINKLHEFETMNWGDITKVAHSHPMPVAKIDSKAKAQLRETKFPEAETLHQLNFGGKKRVWGIRDGIIFHVLWWDPDHTVYQVAKKHT